MDKAIATRAAVAHKVLRACWTLVSAHHRDAVAGDVERMGKALGLAIEAEDWDKCEAVLVESRAWLSQFAGIVLRRCEYAFELPH